MTVNKKIVTSIAASTVLAASLMAATGNGTIKISSGNSSAVIAEELYQLSGEYNASVISSTNYWEYTPDLDGSGTVSDAALNLVFSSDIARVTSTDGFVILDMNDGNKTVAKEILYDSANRKVSFDSDSNVTFSNGGKYGIIALANAKNIALGTPIDVAANALNTIKMNAGQAAHKAATATLELWSTSGTEALRDQAEIDLFDVTPQYSIYCENKFNNLINVENASYSFVSTKHGALDTTNGSAGDVMDVLRDVMSFKVVKTAVDYGLDGNQSLLSITSSDSNTSAAAWTVNSNFNQTLAATGVTTTALANGNTEINVTSADNQDSAGFSDFVGLDASTDTFTVTLDTNGTVVIPETTFTANFYINYDDTNTTYTPAGTYDAGAVIGEWSKFAYIAQVAGATETSATKTKFFITNRSCATVTPKMTLIKDGKTVTFDLEELAVDTQMKVTLEDAITRNEAAITAAGLPTTGQFSVEITISGNAEDFYVYAQAQSKTDIAATKDLPVYNTSTRD